MLGRSVHRRAITGCAVLLSGLLIAIMLCSLTVNAEDDATKIGPDQDALAQTVAKGIKYLTDVGQEPDGSFSKFAGTGPTSLAVTGLLRNGAPPTSPAVKKGLEYLKASAQQDGGIYGQKAFTKNYETCAAVMCFEAANQQGEYNGLLKKAEQFLRGMQTVEDSSDFRFGGAGYGGESRPDLSNTAFLIDALKSTGAGADDEAIQQALAFVSRCQNLDSEHNTTPFAGKVNDGGFYYTPILEKPDEEKETANGGLRSYGTMSYSGLKSLIYAGLEKDDPRVKAVQEWISKNYSVESNPGMGNAGLYYYYATFAKAMDVAGQDFIVDDKGVKHDWRKELAEELAKRQKPDGSWINSNEKWLEGDANLVTAYALLSLSYCRVDNK